MSDEPFLTPPIPLMTAAKARDVARAYKATADQLTEFGLPREATRAMRDSQWWMACAIALAQTKEGGPMGAIKSLVLAFQIVIVVKLFP
jgi:hypothetical protein